MYKVMFIHFSIIFHHFSSKYYTTYTLGIMVFQKVPINKKNGINGIMVIHSPQIVPTNWGEVCGIVTEMTFDSQRFRKRISGEVWRG